MPSPGLRQQQMVRTKLLNSALKLPFLPSNGLKGIFSVSVEGFRSSVSLDANSRARMNECCLVQCHSAYCVVCRHNNAATTVQKLHDKLAAYMWECHGCRGLGEVSEHYIRGKDMTGFAAGMSTHSPSTLLQNCSPALDTSMHASSSKCVSI